MIYSWYVYTYNYGFVLLFFRLLVRRARVIAQQYRITYNESIPVSQLVQKVATVMQEYTQQG